MIHRFLLVGVVLIYLFLAASYAIRTPDWQVPDEPAHYNYIRQIAEEGRLPVMEQGDWNKPYQDELVGSGFNPQLTTEIDRVQFQDHQPLLYYVLAAPIFRLNDGDLTALRFLSVFFGLGILLSTWFTLSLLFPEHPWLPLAGAAFVVFIPQHLAFLGGVNNDPLAVLLVCLNLLAAVRYLKADSPSWRASLLMGFLVGLAFLTKSTIYFLAGIGGLALLMRWYREGWPLREALQQLAAFLVPALLIGGAWWARNLDVYGGTDFLGLQRHNEVAGTQLQTDDYISDHLNGDEGLFLENFLTTTFHSFWGQFGWMSVPMPSRIYQILGAACLFLVAGSGLYMWKERWPRSLQAYQRESLLLFALTIVFVLIAYLYYNLTFVQHQGRYLFPALLPLGLWAAIGISGWLSLLPKAIGPVPLRWLAVPFVGLLALLSWYALTHYIVGVLPNWN